MKRYTFTLNSGKINLEEIYKETQKLKNEIFPVFIENEICWSFLKSGHDKKGHSNTWVLYVKDGFDLSAFDNLKKKYEIEVEPLDDIKKYNGFIFRHNKADIDYFLEKSDDVKDGCMRLWDSPEAYTFNISRYSDTELECYICDRFEYNIEINDEMVKNFAQKHGFDIVE